MAKITIDGIGLEFPDGTLILEAAKAQDIDVPTFCYQKRLTPLASCRMCLVSIEGMPKLQPACATPIADGMVVHTASEKIAETRRSMLELLLANHPLDCPICDKAGECELQDMVFEYGAGVSRFHDRKRVFRSRDIALNKVIVFNANRCIQCQRCVRVCDEVVGAVALGTIEKGMDSEITGFENSLAGCDHCGNCIEVCPVGALMSQPYRYKARPWDLVETDTTCPFCATGCQLTVGVRDGELARVRSKYETGINGETLCVKGRFGIDFIDSENRITTPLVREDDALLSVSWDEAITALRDGVGDPAEAGGARFAGLAAPHHTVETLYLFQKLLRLGLRTNNIDSSNRWARGIHTELPALFGDLYARRPLGDLIAADTVLVIGCAMTDDNPVSDYLLRTRLRQRGGNLFLASARPSRLDKDSRAHVRILPGDEAALIAGLDLAIAGETDADDTIGIREFVGQAAESLKSAATVTVLVGTDMLRAPAAGAALQWLARFLRRLRASGKVIFLQFLFDRANQMGAWEMGVLPTHLPGWHDLGAPRFEEAWGGQLPPEPGMDIHSMLRRCAEGGIDCLYLLGSDPLSVYPDRGLVEKALASVGLLVVQAAHHSATTARADIVLPGAAFGEETGTVTSNEGRAQMMREIRPPMGSARRNIDILGQVGAAIGCDLGAPTPQNVLAEITRLVPSFGALSFAAISQGGVLTGAGAGGPSHAAETPPAPSRPEMLARDPEKLMLVTGDCGFHSGTMSQNSATLRGISKDAYVEIALADGEALGLTQGEKVTVRSSHGETRLTLKLSKHFPSGVAFIPENFAGQPLNQVFRSGEYPCPVEIVRG